MWTPRFSAGVPSNIYCTVNEKWKCMLSHAKLTDFSSLLLSYLSVFMLYPDIFWSISFFQQLPREHGVNWETQYMTTDLNMNMWILYLNTSSFTDRRQKYLYVLISHSFSRVINKMLIFYIDMFCLALLVAYSMVSMFI